MRMWNLSHLRDAASRMDVRPGPSGHRSIDGGKHGRRRASVVGEMASTVCKRENGEGGSRERLAAVAVVQTASSEDDRSKWGGGGDLGGRRFKMTTVKTKRSFLAHFAR